MILGAPTAEQRVEHIVSACNQLMSWSGGLTPFDLEADGKVFHALCRLSTIIGEAANRLPATTKSQVGNVPWRTIIATRNVFIHQYWQIDRAMLINTISNNIPHLVSTLEVWRTTKAPS